LATSVAYVGAVVTEIAVLPLTAWFALPALLLPAVRRG